MNDAAPVDPLTLHHSLLTLDTHIDIPWPTGPDAFEDGRRCVDLPKMQRGGLAAGCFAAYVPQAARTPASEQMAFERAVAMLQAINAMGRSQNGVTARVATTADAIAAAKRDGVVAIIPAVENGFATGTELSRLTRFRLLGARYLTMTHNGHNALADSCNPRKDLNDAPEEHGGLSALGRTAIAELNRLGMLVDVAHASRATMLQAAEESRTPIVSTHSCIRALCDHPRNMDDAQLDALRDVGGVIQITAVPSFLKPEAKADAVSVADFADHIDYAVRRVGIAHVGISSDFDGGGGFSGWMNAADSPNITTELLSRGYDRAALAALWGGNFMRVLRQAEEVAE
ncbi:MAG TPA: membrane dipeptidase [Acetobacteraceae bacterium]|nr:membrane dipeptidase [Acetobacteraceae bacterium]